jgi:ABC transporter substrate binding protein (PQQ-dependent alcohol dehydrogenase system)
VTPRAPLLRRAAPAGITRSALGLALAAPVLAGAALLAAPGASAATLRAVLLQPQDDARLTRSRLERAYLGHPGGPASDGVALGLKASRTELEAAGAEVKLETIAVAPTPEAVKAAARQAEKAGAVLLLTDLEATLTLAAADAVSVPVLNLGAADERLRGADCRRHLWHLGPGERMRADALAQTLVARRWQQVLLLVGPSPADAERGALAEAAIRRFGLKLTARKPFRLSADPRERDLANPQLLTAGAHDVVWVVDGDGEFARTLPYRTATPRPVVGDAGLVALAWHAQYERYGAPQISRRFARDARRPMTAHDWQAWMGGKALAAVALAAPKGPAAAWQQALPGLVLDGSKGSVLDWRPWDGQLRQPLLLTDGQGVVSTAPVEGVLHPKNVLDTLGADAPEKACRARG